jgi:hypothetical protein
LRIERSIVRSIIASEKGISNNREDSILAFEDPHGGEVAARRLQLSDGDKVKCSESPSYQKPLVHGSREVCLFRWQAYPKPFPHRLAWVLDLVTNFRGTGWNWRISSLPPLPGSVLAQLDKPSSEATKGEVLNMTDTKSALQSTFITMALSYLFIDFLKVTMMHDPYFWGNLSAPPPSPLDSLGVLGQFLGLVYRLALSALGVFTAVTYLGSLPTLICLAVSFWIPQTRTWTLVPLEARWLYADYFGPFLSSVLDHGLPGVWSRWWHQLLRSGFVAPAVWISSRLPPSLRRSNGNRALQLFIAFSLSGFLHACGSYSQFAVTRPLSGPFLFFFLQAPAIIFQRHVARSVVPLLPFRPARWVRRLTNFTFVAIWFLLTGPLLADDFAKGGIWLVETVPLSPLRGLGFGAEGEGWWCWHGKWFKQWRGARWWEVGIQIL